MTLRDKSAQSEKPRPATAEALTPAKRKRLEKTFAHASGRLNREDIEYEYIVGMLGECVKGDPTNLDYVQTYVGALQQKYNHNKTGSKLAQFRERGARGALKKALAAKQWHETIEHGLKVLTVNPWDKAALLALAEATLKLGNIEIQLHYLKWAREAAPKDPEINKQCALAAASVKHFDQAIAMWHRVEEAVPDDDEARRQIASLTVQKTIALGGFKEDQESKTADQQQAEEEEQEEEDVLSPEELIRQKIAEDPKLLANYIELAQHFISDEDYGRAEAVYSEAFEVSDGDIEIREAWEDAQLRRLRQEMIHADKSGKKELAHKLRTELIEKELGVYLNRCERYPNNLGFRYDLGYRYQLSGQTNQAIKEYQQARNDPRRKGVCLLRLGECFQKIKQYRLAMNHYEMAITEIPDREPENQKRTLYLAGKMALFLKDLDTGEKHISALAGLDFTYKDVSDLLEKISKMRDRKGQQDAPEELEDEESE